MQTRQTAPSLSHDLSALDTENQVAGQVSGYGSSLSSQPSRFVHPTDASTGQMFGRVVRMDSERIPKQLLYGELTHGKRCRGWLKKMFKDSLKVSLKSFDIDTNSWENQAQDRPSWRALTTKDSRTSEAKNIC